MIKFIASTLVGVMLLITTGCSTPDQILSDIDLAKQAGSVICPAIGTMSPADEQVCNKISGIVVASVTTLEQAYTDYVNSPTTTNMQKVQAAVAAVNKELPQALQDAHIANPRAVSMITALVALVTTAVNEVASRIQPAQGTKTEHHELTPETLKTRWATDVCKGELSCSQRVHVRHLSAKHHFLHF